MRKALRLLAIAALVPLAGHALSVEPVHVERVTVLPLAVTEVVEVGVPDTEIETVVVELNEAEVPPAESIEVIRHTPFQLVVDRYVEPDAVAVDLPWEVADLRMSLLLQDRRREGLAGVELAAAVLDDLERIGFPVETDEPVVALPSRAAELFYFLEPGYRIETRRGVFRDRDVIVREGDFRVPPGHWMHRPGGPHPTPGHVKHHEPGGPPGHTRDLDRPDDRRRPDRAEPPGKAKGKKKGEKKPRPPGQRPDKPDRGPGAAEGRS